jgi:hypothetical protein
MEWVADRLNSRLPQFLGYRTGIFSGPTPNLKLLFDFAEIGPWDWVIFRLYSIYDVSFPFLSMVL